MTIKKKRVILFALILSACVLAIATFQITTATNSDVESQRTSNYLSNKTNSPYLENREQKTLKYEGEFELPLVGATGYASVDLPLHDSPSYDSLVVKKIEAGTGFKIIDEHDDWWLINIDRTEVWIQHQYAFINLPDVLPSIIYDNTNSYSSRFHSSNEPIPNITNHSLYNSESFNKRFNQVSFNVPVLYKTAKKVSLAQQNALQNGDTLILNEAYRPYDVQIKVADELMLLSEMNSKVRDGLSGQPWGIEWFIADGVSNHQMGYAIDVSLASVESIIEIDVGNYSIDIVENYIEYDMPTPIHELSTNSTVYTEAVTSKNDQAWRDASFNSSMTEAAITLQRYCTEAGFTPLASEWWHFNDLEAHKEIQHNPSTGDYEITDNFSEVPV